MHPVAAAAAEFELFQADKIHTLNHFSPSFWAGYFSLLSLSNRTTDRVASSRLACRPRGLAGSPPIVSRMLQLQWRQAGRGFAAEFTAADSFDSTRDGSWRKTGPGNMWRGKSNVTVHFENKINTKKSLMWRIEYYLIIKWLPKCYQEMIFPFLI